MRGEVNDIKIKVINPNTTLGMTKSIDKAAKSVARKDVEILTVSPEMGPESIESYYDEYLCVPGILDEIKKGEKEGADAFVIACYDDPGLKAARELTSCPVIGIVEASLYMASMLAARYSIVTVPSRMTTIKEELVSGYGMDFRVRSIRTIPLGVVEFDRNPELGIELLRKEAYKAFEEDEAEAILLGCAGMTEFSDSLEQELGIPVIDGVVAAVKFAEAIVDIGKTTSKSKTYNYPAEKQISGILSEFSYIKE